MDAELADLLLRIADVLEDAGILPGARERVRRYLAGVGTLGDILAGAPWCLSFTERLALRDDIIRQLDREHYAGTTAERCRQLATDLTRYAADGWERDQLFGSTDPKRSLMSRILEIARVPNTPRQYRRIVESDTDRGSDVIPAARECLHDEDEDAAA